MRAGDAVALDIRQALSAGGGNTFDSQALAGTANTSGEPKFRNRERELELVLDALENDDASHFWFYVAPPQLGKTWFLREIAKSIRLRLHRPSLIHEVDVREVAADAGDPLALLARMYGVAVPEPGTREIAAAISATARYNLCLLDSAELLSASTIYGLRAGLEEVDMYLKEGRNRDARLALVVASRQDDAWRGVTPLRMSIRRLTEFAEEVVLEALCDLAREMGTDHSRSDLRSLARQVHQMSEGLPALLTGYLAWIRQAKWMGLDRLGTRDSFDEIATPYIQEGLLSSSSLYGRRPDQPDELRAALIEALLTLAPYRYFTGSHLSHHARSGVLRDALRRLGWTEEKLWAAVKHTDVLLLPQYEPWYAISPPIRRLLFRHWYGSAQERARAHQAARAFLEAYAVNLTGRERAELLLECLWHEAEALSLAGDPRKTELLTDFAMRLSGELTRSATATGRAVLDEFHDQAVRDFIDHRIGDDQELARAIGDRALFETIRVTMVQPDGGNMP